MQGRQWGLTNWQFFIIRLWGQHSFWRYCNQSTAASTKLTLFMIIKTGETLNNLFYAIYSVTAVSAVGLSPRSSQVHCLIVTRLCKKKWNTEVMTNTNADAIQFYFFWIRLNPRMAKDMGNNDKLQCEFNVFRLMNVQYLFYYDH